MPAKDITSSNNADFKLFLKLKASRGIRKHRLALLSGARAVNETLRDFPERCAGLVFSSGMDLTEDLESLDIALYRLGSDLFGQIDLFDTGSPILLVHCEAFPKIEGVATPGCTLCIPFQDPANVGAVIRTAVAFGVNRVVILKEAAHPFLPKSLRAAGSTPLRIQMYEGPSLEELKAGRSLITLSPEGVDIGRYRFPSSFWLLPGIEGPGLPRSLEAAVRLAIPMEPGVESLNAAMAAGIALYVWREAEGRASGS